MSESLQIDEQSDYDGIMDGLPDIDRHSCQLLGPTALVVQALMGVLVILSLIYKRQREVSRRPWRIWLFDVSKQVLGQLFVHLLNVMISDLVAHHSSGNPCVYYFLNISIDTTLGVAIIYTNLRLLTYLFMDKFHLKGFESGQYGDPPSISFWARQAAVYVLALTTMKILVIGLFAVWPGIFKVGEWLLRWTGGRGTVQVIFTMGIFPIIMNILQFWIIDNIVKATAVAVSLSSPRASEDGREPLFNAHSEDDDDDDVLPSRPHDLENPLPPLSRGNSRDNTKATPSSGSVTESKSESITPGASTPGGQSVAMHAYPPSATSSSPSSAQTPNSSPGMQRSARRRSPPPPLLPRSPLQPAVMANTPSPGSTPLKFSTTSPRHRSHMRKSSNSTRTKDWESSWDDVDDWADRVGEEDWTGKRIEARKGTLSNVWAVVAMESPPIQVG